MIINFNHKSIVNYGDLVAIIGFVVLILYFYNKKNKTKLEKFMFFFVIMGFIADTYFSYNFLNGKF